MEINGKVCLVTGGTKGIGRAIAHALVRKGGNVFITARQKDEVETAAKELSATGYQCDVSSYEQVQRVFREVESKCGGVDVLVNNAGIGIFTTVESMSPEDFEAILKTNLFGVFYCCHEAIPQMKKRGGGYIINISSLAGANPHPE